MSGHEFGIVITYDYDGDVACPHWVVHGL